MDATKRFRTELQRAVSMTLTVDQVTITFGRSQQADRFMAALTAFLVERRKNEPVLPPSFGVEPEQVTMLESRTFREDELVPLKSN